MTTTLTNWWRRNRFWLVALAIVAPLTVGAVFGKSAREWRSRHPAATTVAEGATVTVDGTTFGPASATVQTSPNTPTDAHVVVVSVTVDGTGECRIPTLREASGDRRRWVDDPSALPNVDESTAVAAARSCGADEAKSYTINTSYLVPSDATGPFVVELQTTGATRRQIEFRVRP